MAGAACIATGVGGVAGSAMICAGVNSIVGSCVSESQGGSSLAGWIGGGIGAGMGMALASMPTISATSQGLVNGLNAAFSVFVESVCDFVQQIPHFFS